MESVEDFVRAPTEELLEGFSREQLIGVAEHFCLDVGDKRMKENIRGIVRANLFELGVFKGGKYTGDPSRDGVSTSGCRDTDLTFEQRKELLLLQLEIKRLELEERRLGLPAGAASQASNFPDRATPFDFAGNLRVVPQFNERDPDTFFSLFERVAESREWSEANNTLLLQCVLTGRAQEAYSALTVADSKVYLMVKTAVLRAYELVPEAYRQRFRSWEMSDRQTHVEFARDLVTSFGRWCNSLKVDTYVALCELMVLEQFKNSVPSHIAVYISERKVKTAAEAAALADDYVLTHRGGRNFRVQDGGGMYRAGRWEEKANPHGGEREMRGPPLGDSEICHYCRERGHWKADCPKAKTSRGNCVGQFNSAACAVSVVPLPVISPCQQIDEPCGWKDPVFSAFVSTGYVSLVGSDISVPVKILRDTASYDSYILSSVLPFSEESGTGDFVRMRGMGMTVVSVPLHSVVLSSGLVQGEVAMGVRPVMPIGGVDVILGTGLAGSRVWAEGPPPIMQSSSPTVTVKAGENVKCSPAVLVACSVTRAVSRAQEGSEQGEEVSATDSVVIPDWLLLVSRSELVMEQKADVSLSPFFEVVLSTGDGNGVTRACQLHGGLLVRKWWSRGQGFIGGPAYQIVVPVRFREDLLRKAHGQSGHLGVRKTCGYLLRHVFWPGLRRDVSHVGSCHACRTGGAVRQRPGGQVLGLLPGSRLQVLEGHSGFFPVHGQGTGQSRFLSTPKYRRRAPSYSGT
ncbi:hypothetical protein CgunFtcFv8_018924 [Champsocephalus gunnari]|uniref:Gypsy retrotransposon integrase-like protein 1 n=1 Tax=Champsocephalus gunnari TaxID=52237 RepID=A0AAN8DED7_CHAGU|nr:hypothetical protein CgunFtcFv8_018924 [Champsocephalus gunnari]